MLLRPPGPCFQGVISNFSGRPAFGAGTTHTTGVSNAKSAYVEFLAGSAITFDCYAIEIIIAGCMKIGDNNQVFLDIGVDPANSHTYTTLIANLQGSNASFLDGGDASGGSIGGLGYFFPLFIKAGTQIGIRGQTDDNTAAVPNILMKLFGKPQYPEMARAGSYCTTFGANTATTRGAAITPGTTAEGAWADVSGADTTRPHWYWEFGFGVADTVTAAVQIYFNDLGVGDGSNKQIVQHDVHWGGGDNECITKRSHPGMGYYDAPVGVRPYVRSQSALALESNYNSCVYAVGGIGGT